MLPRQIWLWWHFICGGAAVTTITSRHSNRASRSVALLTHQCTSHPRAHGWATANLSTRQVHYNHVSTTAGKYSLKLKSDLVSYENVCWYHRNFLPSILQLSVNRFQTNTGNSITHQCNQSPNLGGRRPLRREQCFPLTYSHCTWTDERRCSSMVHCQKYTWNIKAAWWHEFSQKHRSSVRSRRTHSSL